MTQHASRARAALAAAAALPLLIGVTAAPAHAADQRTAIAGTRPAAATVTSDAGPAPTGDTVDARIYFAGRDPQGLAAYAQAVSTPGSDLYRRYLSADQVRERFGATDAQRAAVADWARSAGLTVTARTDTYLAVRADVAHAQQAFGTDLHRYTKDGRTYRAPVSQVTLPTAVATAVLTVTGLDTAPVTFSHATLPPPPAAYNNAGPCSAYYGEKQATALPPAYGSSVPYAVCGYTGRQLRGAYGVPEDLKGRGVDVAVVGAYVPPYLAQDTDRYAHQHDERGFGPGQLAQVLPSAFTETGPRTADDPGGCNAQGWYEESTLDVEAVHAVAPAAHVTYVSASSCSDQDLLDAMGRIVDQHLATIVSSSWGSPEVIEPASTVAAYENLFMRGAVQGIGFYFASGDLGDWSPVTHAAPMVSYPGSDPWATSVGGTSLAVTRENGYGFETGWGSYLAIPTPDGTAWANTPGAFVGGSGGGASAVFGRPAYQAGTVSAATRTVPDLAADADPATGFRMGMTQTDPDGGLRYGEYRIGGTSLACPIVAALQADAQQAQQGLPIGFANPSLYALAPAGAFHDVTAPATPVAQARVEYVNGFDATAGTEVLLSTQAADTSLTTGPGYDTVTGLGTLSRRYFEFHGSEHRD